jgi:2-keto-4-pentenoate hydratase/2-oxohepta-3-ene-1,7-dioic acid hydratase in catechol pathway
MDLAPRRIVALGLTYRDHAREVGERLAATPAVFERAPASLARDGRVIMPSRATVCAALERLEPGLGAELSRRHPEFPVLLDYEIEVGFVIGERGQLGWLLANDVTARTVQLLGEGARDRMAFWGASKSLPSTLLVGDVVVDGDELPRVALELRVNGEPRQRSHTSELAYSSSQILAFASARGALAVGDMVLTGTPGGIALTVPRWKRAVADVLLGRWGKLAAAFRSARGNRRFLQVGDVIEMSAGPLGSLRAIVEAES